jgi:hypothetical protein
MQMRRMRMRMRMQKGIDQHFEKKRKLGDALKYFGIET